MGITVGGGGGKGGSAISLVYSGIISMKHDIWMVKFAHLDDLFWRGGGAKC